MIIHHHISDTVGYLAHASTCITVGLKDYDGILKNKTNLPETINYFVTEYEKVITKHKSSIEPIYSELAVLKIELLNILKGVDVFEILGWLQMNRIIVDMQKSICVLFKDNETFKENLKENFPHLNLNR